MGVLSDDILKELPFDAMPDACILEEHSRAHTKTAGKWDVPEMVWVAPGAALAGLEITIWECPYEGPKGKWKKGFIMHSELIEKPYDPRWGDWFPKEDYFSSYQHMDEIIQRHTHGMLNLNRLKELNRIWNRNLS